MPDSSTMAVLPALSCIRLSEHRAVLLGRFLSGMQAYRRHWPGKLMAVLEPAPASELETNLDRTLGGDNIEVDLRELDFDVRIARYDSSELGRELKEADIALAAVSYRQNHVGYLAQKLDLPIVYNSEYTLRTRLQIVRAEESNPIVVARRIAWELNQERLHRAAIRASDGLQANGVPTFDAYRSLTESSILYFDGRMEEQMMISDESLENRLQSALQGKPLRLTWSGRMNKMKGADQLLEVAHHLRNMGVDFTLDVYGGGVLDKALRRGIQERGLQDHMHMKGFIPFEELVERTRHNYDAWLCCHPQGDPSGAYLETLGHGLPILGYANEALAGVLALVDAGRVVPINQPEALARLVRDVDQDRRRLARWAQKGLAFARQHSFDHTFERRIEHIESVIIRTGKSGRNRPIRVVDSIDPPEDAPPHPQFTRRETCISCGSKRLSSVWSDSFASPKVSGWLRELRYSEAAYRALGNERFELVRCSDCKLSFHARILDDVGLAMLYSEWIDNDQIEQAEQTLGLNHEWAFEHGVQRVKHVLRIRDTLNARFSGPFRVLDFGCGDGHFLHMVRAFGLDAVGVDRSAARRARAAGIGLEIVPSIEELPGRWRPVHAISLFEVLEHLPDPVLVLEEVRSLLVPGGMLVLEVPDCTGIDIPSDIGEFHRVAPTEHINCFTPESLESLCRRAGFAPLPREPAWVTTRPGDLVKTGISKFYRPRRTSAYFEKV